MPKSRKQWAIERDRELIEEALDFDDVAITRLPMRAKLRCRSCGHCGVAVVPCGRSNPRFKCRKCGSRLSAYLT
jgi:tRNA(Ile2) C34 agmatinyltransferase TiaS